MDKHESTPEQEDFLRGKLFRHIKDVGSAWFTPGDLRDRGVLSWGNVLLGLGISFVEVRHNGTKTYIWFGFYSLTHKRIIWLLWNWVKEDLREVLRVHA